MLSPNHKLTIAGAAIMASLVLLEGNVLTVYEDKVAGGVPTVCAGETESVNGKPLVVGEKFTEEECEEVNEEVVKRYSLAVDACITEPMHQFTYDAFTLFAVNVGVHGVCKRSRAIKLYNQGKHKEACNALAISANGEPAWSYSKGKYVQGLQNRRLHEREMCLDGVKQLESGNKSRNKYVEVQIERETSFLEKIVLFFKGELFF